MAAGDVRNLINSCAAPGTLDCELIPAVNVTWDCISGGRGPTRSTPGVVRICVKRPLPTLRYAIDLAFSKARLNALTELMSGFGVPALTSTPIPERAMSVRVSGTILPSRIHWSMGDEPLIKTSNGSPASIRRRNAVGKSLEP